MQIPESLALEVLGRQVLTIEVQKRQLEELAERVRRVEAAHDYMAQQSQGLADPPDQEPG